MSMSMSMSIGI